MNTINYYLINANKTIYPTNDQEWYRFMRDRRYDLIMNSSVEPIKSEDKFKYKYNLRLYLKDKSYPIELVWIVLWLNQLDSESDFSDIGALLLPKMSVIELLYAKYKSFNTQYNKIKG